MLAPRCPIPAQPLSGKCSAEFEGARARLGVSKEDSQRSQREYGRLGAEYVVRSEINAFNGAFERPAIKALIGEVSGLRVLDAACAGGTLSEWLVERGAQVVALDVTAEMVSYAHQQLGDRAMVVQADLAEGLPLTDASFDLIVSSFTLHYLRDWHSVLREFRRSLRAGGALVVSTHHPSNDIRLSSSGDCFATELLEDTWTGYSDVPVTCTSIAGRCATCLERCMMPGL